VRTTVAALLVALGLVLVALGDNTNSIIAGGLLCVAGWLVNLKMKGRNENA
jgi:drug/metabolite transporter (DMT)-like permease